MAKIRELITEETWCKGAFGGSGKRRCALTWIMDVYGNDDYASALFHMLKTIGMTVLPYWNDAPERTFAEVKAAFEKADL